MTLAKNVTYTTYDVERGLAFYHGQQRKRLRNYGSTGALLGLEGAHFALFMTCSIGWAALEFLWSFWAF